MSGDASHAPIAVFAYNRARHLASMLQSLQQCEGFDQSQITIFVDGPRHEADRPAVEAVREMVRKLGLPNVQHVFADTNNGLKQSIYTGVTRMVEEYGRVIVLEDDLVLSPIALNYFNRFLDHYAEMHKVWSIVGYQYDAPQLRGGTRALTLPFAHPWGWATWARAWQKFDPASRPQDSDLKSATFRAAFDMNGLYPFSGLLEQSIRGKVSSWFIHWYYTVLRHGGRSIFPPQRVLDNHGLGGGTHATGLNPQNLLVKRPPLMTSVPEFCDPLSVDYAALDLLRQSWELKVQRTIARIGDLKRRLRA